MKSISTCEQSKNCSSRTIKWPRLLLFLFLAIISFNVTAQLTIDGNPIDWTNFTTIYPTNAYRADANNSNDNQFTTGSKDENLISGLSWNVGNTNNKGDISNAGAILTVEGGHNILYFCGDRAVNNGAANIGFWFYKNPVGLIAGGTFGPGAHANGDLLVLTNFTNGGAIPNFEIHVWGGVTANSAGSLGPALLNLAGITGRTNFGASTSVVPSNFTYASSVYPEGDFFEGRIDMNTALPGVAPCFNSFLLETRNSPSITASLQDLAAGFFTQTIPAPTPTGAARCSTGNVTLTASGCTGGTLKWYDAVTGGNLVFTGASYTVNLTTTTTFYVSCTTADGCVSARAAVTGTINGIPTVVASATPATNVNIGSAPPHYQLNTTVGGTLSNPGYNYSWSQNPPQGPTTGTLSATNIPNPTFTANIAQSFTWTVTAVDKLTGCSSTSTVTRIVDPTAGCPTVPRSAICSGTTNTYTASVGPASTETWVWSVNNGASVNAVPANGGQSISVTAGTQSFTLTLTKSYANTSLSPTVCTYAVTVNPLAAPPNVTYIPPTCTQSTFSVQVTNPEVGSSYKLTQLDGNIVTLPASGGYVSGNLIFTGLHIGQGYSIVSTTSAGCKSNPNECGVFTSLIAGKITQTSVTDDVRIQLIADAPSVFASPNPFVDKIRFSVTTEVSGNGSLELYNLMGQKVHTVYQGYFDNNMLRTFEYKVPLSQRANLIYLLRVGNKKTSGKLIGMK